MAAPQQPLTPNPNPNPKLAGKLTGVGEEGEFGEEKIRVRSCSKSHWQPIALPYLFSTEANSEVHGLPALSEPQLDYKHFSFSVT
jgi:hypothetical protein